MFASNFPYFLEHSAEVRKVWLKQAAEAHSDQPEIDLHIHMISTIASAEEVYKNQIGPYTHRDELWLWIPPTQQAHDHLSSFLASFQYGAKKIQDDMDLEIMGPEGQEYLQIFVRNFFSIPYKISNKTKSSTVAVLRFRAGTLNSRKSMVTPYIPRLVP